MWQRCAMVPLQPVPTKKSTQHHPPKARLHLLIHVHVPVHIHVHVGIPILTHTHTRAATYRASFIVNAKSRRSDMWEWI